MIQFGGKRFLLNESDKSTYKVLKVDSLDVHEISKFGIWLYANGILLDHRLEKAYKFENRSTTALNIFIWKNRKHFFDRNGSFWSLEDDYYDSTDQDLSNDNSYINIGWIVQNIWFFFQFEMLSPLTIIRYMYVCTYVSVILRAFVWSFKNFLELKNIRKLKKICFGDFQFGRQFG